MPLELVGDLAHLGHRGELLVAGVDRQVEPLDAVGVLVGGLELVERGDQPVDQVPGL